MSVKTTPAQHQSNLRNVYGTFAIEGMTTRTMRTLSWATWILKFFWVAPNLPP